MKEAIVCKTKVTSATASQQQLDVGTMAIVGSMGFISALIGGGALICFVSALVNAGPLEVLHGFLSALTIV